MVDAKSPPQTAAANQQTAPTGPLTQLPEYVLGYWHVVNQGLSQAQQEVSQAQTLEQQAQQLRQSATARAGAYESYLAHLYETFGLDQRTDRIESSGMIVRGAGSNGAS